MRSLLSSLLLLAGAAHAETLFEYGRQCAEQISEIDAMVVLIRERHQTEALAS